MCYVKKSEAILGDYNGGDTWMMFIQLDDWDNYSLKIKFNKAWNLSEMKILGQ